MAQKNHFTIIRTVSVVDSVQTLQPGEEATISAAQFAFLNSVQSVCYRLNKEAGWKEYWVTTPDNGCTLVIKHYRKDEQPDM